MRVSLLAERGSGLAALQIVRTRPDLSRPDAALTAGVSSQMVMWARRLVRSGVPELIVAVEEGRIALYMAARVCRWAPESQLEVVRILRRTEGRALSLRIFSRCISGNAGSTLAVDRDETPHARHLATVRGERDGEP